MNRSEALAILGASSDEKDSIIEAYDLEIFNAIQLFLKDPVVPYLIDARKKKMNIIGEAYSILCGSTKNEIFNLELADLNSLSLWNDLFLSYENNKAKLRHSISNAKSVDGLIFLLDELKTNEITFAKKMSEKLSSIPYLEVKITEPIALLSVKIELNKLLEQGIIDNSLDSLVSIPANLDIFNLSKEINRLRKLIE